MIKRIITGVLTLALVILQLVGCSEVVKEVEVVEEVVAEPAPEVEVVEEVVTEPAPDTVSTPPQQKEEVVEEEEVEVVTTIGSNVQITKIFYDGLVYRIESDEYVEITNLGSEPQDLAGCDVSSVSLAICKSSA